MNDANKYKFRFLNYKKYTYFEQDLNDNKIPLDAIVFVQDRHIIWAHGTEYICNVYMRDDTQVDLHEYLTIEDAARTYQTKAVTESAINSILGRLGIAENDIANITSSVGQISTAITNIQNILNNLPSAGDIDTTELEASIRRDIPKLVTLTIQQYQALGDNVDPNTYYFTYDGEEEPSNWVFGDRFPVIFTNTWTFGGTFPIKLN